MKKRYTLVLVLLLALTTTVSAARPADRDPSEPFVKKVIRFIKFIAQPHDPGILPPHP
jgi:hypothetical protein